MALNGKWSLFDVQNAAAYFDAIKSPEEYKEKLRKVGEASKVDRNAYVEELNVDKAAGTLHRSVYINGEKVKESGEVKLGIEIDGKSADGRPAKVKLVLESDSKLVRHEAGSGFSTVTTFEVSGDTLTVSNSGNGASCVSKYKRV